MQPLLRISHPHDLCSWLSLEGAPPSCLLPQWEFQSVFINFSISKMFLMRAFLFNLHRFLSYSRIRPKASFDSPGLSLRTCFQFRSVTHGSNKHERALRHTCGAVPSLCNNTASTQTSRVKGHNFAIIGVDFQETPAAFTSAEWAGICFLFRRPLVQ